MLFLSSVSLKAFLVSLCVPSALHPTSYKKRSQCKALFHPITFVQDGATEIKIHFILITLSSFEHPFMDALAGLLLLMCFTRFFHSGVSPSKLLLKNLFGFLEWDFVFHLLEPCHPQALVLSLFLQGFLFFILLLLLVIYLFV